MILYVGYLAKIFDGETDLLYGDLKEEIYMECSQGMSNIGKDYCHFKRMHLKLYGTKDMWYFFAMLMIKFG